MSHKIGLKLTILTSLKYEKGLKIHLLFYVRNLAPNFETLAPNYIVSVHYFTFTWPQ